MDEIILDFNIKKSVYLVVFLLLLGLIVGPFYSVVSVYNLSKSQSTYGTEYDMTSKDSNFLPFTERTFGQIAYGPIALHESTIYVLDTPNQFMLNGSFDNFANNGTYELLELNFTNHFSGIQSIKTYNLSSMPLSLGANFQGTFYYNNQFWTFSYTHHPSLVSFNKQGQILSNNTFPSPPDNLTFQSNPLGFYNNQFWLYQSVFQDINNKSVLISNNITAYSLNPLVNVFSRNMSNFNSLAADFIVNNTLWMKSYYNDAQFPPGFYEFSMQDIMNSSKLSVHQGILDQRGHLFPDPYYDKFFGWNTSLVAPIATTIYNHKVIEIDTSTVNVRFNGTQFIPSLTTLSGGYAPDLLIGVVVTNPIIYHITTFESVTFLFGYVLTGVMSVVIVKMDKKYNFKKKYVEISTKIHKKVVK